ncbi:uncharacterized protein B0I36DRAFT_379973 [Microdochium trichocladiopsis]|uniref:ABC transporter n=1 Tax=Microdochium trichocladiopsis TaxID=1682393 RepID=A0A9P9C0J2_9PEZI|nr:uncharacterized protein B0I36DRAFT_379973 [Microdochium trichocladiopsis]KAH7041159.1 hypothetical protein B0I36DRAFT_379973 [Microdochium trichocladiopsis]
MPSAMMCPPSVDASLGPWAGPQCRGGVDFTLLFELVFFSILPLCVFVPSALYRVVVLRGCPVIAKRPSSSRLWKLGASALLFACAIVVLVLLSTSLISCYELAIAAASLDVVAAGTIGALSWHQHASSPRPSYQITLFLSIHILLNLATARTLWLIFGAAALPIAYLVHLSLKCIVLVLENIEKRQVLDADATYSKEEYAGPLSRIFFGWLSTLFVEGHRSFLALDTLMPIAADLQSSSIGRFQDKAFGGPRMNTKLLWQLFANLRAAFLVPIIPRLALIGFTVSQPWLVHTTINYTNIPRDERNKVHGQFLIPAYILTFVGYALSSALYWHLVNRYMIKIRARLISYIYSCTTRSAGGAARVDAMAPLTLMTVDVEKAMVGLEDVHEVWANLVQIAIAIYILASQISWASASPITVATLCLLITVPFLGKIGAAQKNWNQAVQDRISFTTAVLDRLSDVRSLGIGLAASQAMKDLRAQEIRKSHWFRLLMMAVLVISQATLVLGPLATLGLYAVVVSTQGSSQVLAAEAFTALTLVNLIAGPFGVVVQALPSIAAGLSSLDRLDALAKVPEAPSSKGDRSTDEKKSMSARCSTADESSKEPAQSLHAFDPISRDAHEITENEKVGMAIVAKSASYAWPSQEDAVRGASFSVAQGSIVAVTGPIASGKSTLLLGLLGEVQRTAGDSWVMGGEVGFCAESPWLFSGTVRRNILCGATLVDSWYREVVAACGLEHDLEIWPDGDMHEVGNEGGNLSGGQRQRVALARLVFARRKIAVLDNPFSGLDPATAQHVVQKLMGPLGLFRRNSTTVVIASNSASVIAVADQVFVMDAHGGLTVTTSDDKIMAMTVLPVTTTVREEQGRTDDSTNADLRLLEAKADLKRKTGDWRIYSFYTRAAGLLNTVSFLVVCLACAFCFQFSTIWVQWWSEARADSPVHSTGYYIGIYAMLSILGLAGMGVAAHLLLVTMTTASGTRLHSLLVQTVFAAPAAFFKTLDSGVTLNRFNQDLQMLDYSLPLAGFNTVIFAALCALQAIIISVSIRLMAVTIPLVLAVIYVVQKFYLRTSRQLRLLDIEAKAPLYSNFKDTVHGMPTMRAFGRGFGDFLKAEHLHRLDMSQRPIYLLYTVQRWLALTMDLLVALLATILIVVATEAPDTTISGAAMGVALVNLTSFNQSLTALVRYWASLETSLGAVARIRDFSINTPVASGVDSVASRTSAWQQGPTDSLELEGGAHHRQSDEIRFQSVSATWEAGQDAYAVEAKDANQSTGAGIISHSGPSDGHSASSHARVLSSVTLTFRPGSKTAIMGRSGSGKSTLLSALFRIVPISSGTITIGDSDLSTMDPDLVQRRLNAVTQMAFFLPARTIRENLLSSSGPDLLDPATAEGSSDVPMLNEVLASVGLSKALEERGGLDAELVPTNWSKGQMQLLSLARAVVKGRLLRRKPQSGWKILILDEIASSVDTDTAELMRQNIKTEFADYTVLSVVHNTSGIEEDMDEVVVLDQGRVAAQGPPRQVLPRLNG